jgi:hypothetical protein
MIARERDVALNLKEPSVFSLLLLLPLPKPL